MICTKCNSDGVHNMASGKEFWYCRTCKEEIKLQEVEAPLSYGDVLVDYWNSTSEKEIKEDDLQFYIDILDNDYDGSRLNYYNDSGCSCGQCKDEEENTDCSMQYLIDLTKGIP